MIIRFEDLIPGETFIYEETLYRKENSSRADQLYSNLPTGFPLSEPVILTERTKEAWMVGFLQARRQLNDV